jgi:hypothetical protein
MFWGDRCWVSRQGGAWWDRHLELGHLELGHLELRHLELRHLELRHLELRHLELRHLRLGSPVRRYRIVAVDSGSLAAGTCRRR